MVQETQMVLQRSNGQRVGLYKTAILLSQITVFYNLLEGLVSVFLGLEDGDPIPARFRDRFLCRGYIGNRYMAYGLSNETRPCG